MAFGADIGTYNIISCRRNDKDLVYKREVNAFIEIALENDFVFNMMKKSGVPLIKRDDAKLAYAVGEAAVNFAYTIPKMELRRPMKNGCVNPGEHDAYQILNIMIHSMIDAKQDNEVVYYSVPANAINEKTDADYHNKILEAIFKAYESPEGHKVDARPINEGMAVVYSESEAKMFTALGASFGAGMVNVAFGLFGAEVFSFALTNSGDWIDEQVSRALGESIAFVNKEKTKVDLSAVPTNMLERAVQAQYEIMVQKTVRGIREGLETHSDKKARLDHPIDIIIAGGTASPKGFDELFRNVVQEGGLPIEVGEIIRPENPVRCVAYGCLVAAEHSG